MFGFFAVLTCDCFKIVLFFSKYERKYAESAKQYAAYEHKYAVYEHQYALYEHM